MYWTAGKIMGPLKTSFTRSSKTITLTEQGSDFTSTLFATLLAWIGTRHIFSITDRYANGVERTLKEVSRYVKS